MEMPVIQVLHDKLHTETVEQNVKDCRSNSNICQMDKYRYKNSLFIRPVVGSPKLPLCAVVATRSCHSGKMFTQLSFVQPSPTC